MTQQPRGVAGTAGTAGSAGTVRNLEGPTGLEDLEIELLLDGVYRHYGYDFRHYARASLRRRLMRRVSRERLPSITALLDRLLHDEGAMARLLADMSVSVTSMFRDPTFYAALREKVVPMLRTYPFLRVWNAGCATGEETYSLAILLSEIGLYERTRIYATDMDESVVRTASDGVFPLAKMKEYTENYLAAGGSRSFSDYYVSAYDGARFDRSLARNVIFAQHNLVSDRSFNEFHVIVCRNVLIYFDAELQERTHRLFWESLAPFGVLALGHKESVSHTAYKESYTVVDGLEKIYRRTG